MSNIGTFDTVEVFQTCPYCGVNQYFDAQTKDLGCSMYTYSPVSKYKGQFAFLDDMPVFKRFPEDKLKWNSRKDLEIAKARVPKKFRHLKFVSVVADCHSTMCQKVTDINTGYFSGFGRMFEGKIKIEKGCLKGDIYDIKTNTN